MKTARSSLLILAPVLALGLLTAGFVRADGVPVVQNGSFEDPAKAPNSINDITGTGVPGWTGNSLPNIHQYIINGNVDNSYGVLYGTTPFGEQYLGLNGLSNRVRSIESQVVGNIVAGQAYAFSVYYSNIGGASGLSLDIVVSDGPDGDGQVIGDESFQPQTVGPYGDGEIVFSLATLDFTAISTGSVTFSLSNQSAGTLALDNASIAVLGVPEPSTWGLLILGAAMLGLTVRCQRRRRCS